MSLARVLPLLFTTGCATLFAAGPDRVPVMTNPPGAFVYLNGVPVGRTPTQIYLDRDNDARIEIFLPGFEPVRMMRGKELNGWFIGSLIFFVFIVPPLVDLMTGNYRRYDDGSIAIGLTPLPYQPQPVQPQAPTYAPPPTSQPPIVTPPAAPPPPKT